MYRSLVKYHLSIILVLFITSCENNNTEKQQLVYYKVSGLAQGTIYNITYSAESDLDLSLEIDSILKDYDLSLSIYKDSSLVSKINSYKISNNKECSFYTLDKYFIDCFNKSKIVYNNTKGAFNPAIYPLVDYWGFFDENFNENVENDQKIIDSLLKIIDFNDSSFYLKNDNICKTKYSKLDFNAIAQGHSVDIIANYLNNLGIANYLIEIGGEIRAQGKSMSSNYWNIGIDKPVDNSKPGENDFQKIVALNNQSLATSGNYRKFYTKNGKKYSHTINPKTGRPIEHNLLSATVITKQAAFADAYATAFMVMGVDKTKDFINKNDSIDLEVLLVFDVNGTNKLWQTEGF